MYETAVLGMGVFRLAAYHPNAALEEPDAGVRAGRPSPTPSQSKNTNLSTTSEQINPKPRGLPSDKDFTSQRKGN